MSLHNFLCILISRLCLISRKSTWQLSVIHLFKTPSHSPKEVEVSSRKRKWRQRSTPTADYSHTQYARSRWCIVLCTLLHCNNFKFTIHLMIVGLLSTALFLYLKCQDQQISKNCRSTFIFCSSWNLWGNPFFTFSLPGGRRAPLPPRQLRHWLSDDKDIQRQMRYQYCAANKLRASFSRCANAVKNVLFRSFCTSMYAS